MEELKEIKTKTEIEFGRRNAEREEADAVERMIKLQNIFYWVTQ